MTAWRKRKELRVWESPPWPGFPLHVVPTCDPGPGPEKRAHLLTTQLLERSEAAEMPYVLRDADMSDRYLNLGQEPSLEGGYQLARTPCNRSHASRYRL